MQSHNIKVLVPPPVECPRGARWAAGAVLSIAIAAPRRMVRQPMSSVSVVQQPAAVRLALTRPAGLRSSP